MLMRHRSSRMLFCAELASCLQEIYLARMCWHASFWWEFSHANIAAFSQKFFLLMWHNSRDRSFALTWHHPHIEIYLTKSCWHGNSLVRNLPCWRDIIFAKNLFGKDVLMWLLMKKLSCDVALFSREISRANVIPASRYMFDEDGLMWHTSHKNVLSCWHGTILLRVHLL